MTKKSNTDNKSAKRNARKTSIENPVKGADPIQDDEPNYVMGSILVEGGEDESISGKSDPSLADQGEEGNEGWVTTEDWESDEFLDQENVDPENIDPEDF